VVGGWETETQSVWAASRGQSARKVWTTLPSRGCSSPKLSPSLAGALCRAVGMHSSTSARLALGTVGTASPASVARCLCLCRTHRRTHRYVSHVLLSASFPRGPLAAPDNAQYNNPIASCPSRGWAWTWDVDVDARQHHGQKKMSALFHVRSRPGTYSTPAPTRTAVYVRLLPAAALPMYTCLHQPCTQRARQSSPRAVVALCWVAGRGQHAFPRRAQRRRHTTLRLAILFWKASRKTKGPRLIIRRYVDRGWSPLPAMAEVP